MTSPKPKAFEKSARPRCFLCIEREVTVWIHESLIESKKIDPRRPTATLVHQEVVKAFPEQAPAHENSTRHHLLTHEPAYYGWYDGQD